MYGIPGSNHAPLSEDKSEIGTFRGLVFAVLGGFAVFVVIGLVVRWVMA